MKKIKTAQVDIVIVVEKTVIVTVVIVAEKNSRVNIAVVIVVIVRAGCKFQSCIVSDERG